MGPLSAVDSVFTKYFTMRGRASRSEFWWYSLFQSLVLVVALTLDIVMFDPEIVTFNPFAIVPLTSAWLLVSFIPNFTVAIRRLHDIGKSGFWYLINWVPIIGPVIYLVFLCLPSNHGENTYGQPPFGGGGFGGGMVPRAGNSRPSNGPSNAGAMAGYAVLNRVEVGKTPEQIAAQKAEFKDYYRRQVLGQTA